jgi:hypothetical protein
MGIVATATAKQNNQDYNQEYQTHALAPSLES